MRYPKTFKFTGWHPFCRCYAVPVLKTRQELQRDVRRIAAGDEPLPSTDSVNAVPGLPGGFTDWLDANTDRIAKAASLPYFIRDNYRECSSVLSEAQLADCRAYDNALNPAPAKPLRSPLEIADERHAARTQADIDRLKHDYWLRYEPDYLTEAQREANIAAYLQIERDLGIKRGRPMTFEEADTRHPNPLYSPRDPKRQAYRENCQTSVLVFDLRRRGFNVDAKGYTRGSMLENLAKKPRQAWSIDGHMPGGEGMSVGKNLMVKFNKFTAPPGRYAVQIEFDNSRNVGHIISFERKADGSFIFHDPQSGKSFASLTAYAKNKGVSHFSVFQMDDCAPVPSWVKGCVTTSGAKATTAQVGRLTGTQGLPGKTSWFERCNRADNSRQRVALMREQIDSPQYVRLGYHSSKTGSVYGINMGDFDRALTQSEIPKNLALARKLAKQGYDVYLLPNPHGTTSADYILRKNGKLIYAEGKRMDGKNSLDHLLAKGATQSECVVADIIGRKDFNYIYSNVKSFFEQNDTRELILFKGKRIIKISRQLASSKDFAKTFKGIWSSKK